MSTPITASDAVSDSFSGFIAASPVHLCSPSKASRLGKQPVHPLNRPSGAAKLPSS
jgi:hypothetical protein